MEQLLVPFQYDYMFKAMWVSALVGAIESSFGQHWTCDGPTHLPLTKPVMHADASTSAHRPSMPMHDVPTPGSGVTLGAFAFGQHWI